MLFNSAQFAIFFPVVTALYWLIPHRRRWSVLLFASCLFYMAFIPIYITILFVTILIDYFAAIYIEKTEGRTKSRLLLASIVSTCLVLFVFKYFGFFNSNLSALASFIGWNYPTNILNIILPIGLSFHTFQSLSYVIEVYRGHQRAERHFGIYSLYVMFYPQLVAGPIERPQNLLHQFHSEKSFNFDDFTSGLRLILWGLFKKVVIADRLAILVNAVYDEPRSHSGPILVTATLAFAYQIYCDFSGYSDIAIGAARVMGFKLMTNFNRPYAARSIAEFWQRWHISLSTWFRDYVYVPLGGSRVSTWCHYRNLMITFLISGLWHGANWTFVIWGGLNGAYLVLGKVLQPVRRQIAEVLGLSEKKRLLNGLSVASTLLLVCVSWVFFRADSVRSALYVMGHLSHGWWDWSVSQGLAEFSRFDALVALLAITILEGVQWYSARLHDVGQKWSWPVYARWAVYYGMIAIALVFGVFQGSKFVYFQF